MNTFLGELKTTAVEVAGSKKWMGAIVAFLVVVILRAAAKFNLGLTPDEARELATHIVSLTMVAIGGQALKDYGTASASAPDTTTTATTTEDGNKTTVTQTATPPPLAK